MAIMAGRKGVAAELVDRNGKIIFPEQEKELPDHTSADAGKVLSVDSYGEVEWTELADELPEHTSADAGKVLAVDSDGEVEWTEPTGELPEHTSADVGKVLSVDTDGGVEWTEPTGELPDHTSADAGKVLSVDSDGGVEWTVPSGGGGDVYVHFITMMWTVSGVFKFGQTFVINDNNTPFTYSTFLNYLVQKDFNAMKIYPFSGGQLSSDDTKVYAGIHYDSDSSGYYLSKKPSGGGNSTILPTPSNVTDVVIRI